MGATTTQGLLISGFTNTNSITVVHDLDRLNLNYRVVCSGTSRPDLVQSASFIDGNERNAFTVNLVSNETGFVQILDSDIYSINLPTPENNTKLVDLPQASEITDTFVSGVTLNSTTLELERTEGKSTLTTDLSSINTDRFVSGGTFNKATSNIDFVGNSSETTFSVGFDIIQQDRQIISLDSSDTTSSTFVDFDTPLSLTTGNLGGTGDYIIRFSCFFENNNNSENAFVISVDGTEASNSEVMFEVNGNQVKNRSRDISTIHLAKNITNGTVIKALYKTTNGTLLTSKANLVIDGIRTNNNIS